MSKAKDSFKRALNEELEEITQQMEYRQDRVDLSYELEKQNKELIECLTDDLKYFYKYYGESFKSICEIKIKLIEKHLQKPIEEIINNT